VKKEFYQLLLENLYDGVYYVDTKNRITLWNQSAERITGYKKEEVIGSRCSDNILRHIDEKGNELCVKGCPLKRTLQDGEIRDADVYLHHKDGHRIPISIRISPITDDAGNIIGAVEVFSDISKNLDLIKEMEGLRRDAFIDHLTGIGNRKYAEMNMENRITEMNSHQVPFGILFLDIDHFKKVNDTHGHDLGDKVLIMVAKTISNTIRGMDVICRWGGEEFVVILPNINLETIKVAAERVRMFVKRSWITLDKKHNLAITISVGATMASVADTPDSLLKRADTLMYKSKTGGRDRVTFDADISE